MEIKPGDIAVTTRAISLEDGPSALQSVFTWATRLVQGFNEVDCYAYYTHALTFLDSQGSTFEALWHYRSQNFFQAYASQDVMIGRPLTLDKTRFNVAVYQIRQELTGRRYPALRIPLFFLTPRLLKYIPGKPVCSELVGLGLRGGGVINFWKGITPSYIADMIRNWRNFELLYEGKCPGANYAEW
jgi:hypothetical protein